MEFFKRNIDNIRVATILIVAFISMAFFVHTQPFGDGPDEINRYKVVSYIQNHGTLPVGDAPEVIIDGYGASYAFQPMLTYMIDGYLLRILSPFSLEFSTELVIARYVNVLFGLIAAWYVVKISRLLFEDKLVSYLYAMAIIFLPQNLFIHTYVNTDSMGLLSIAVMFYSLLLGYKNDFDLKNNIRLAIGISLCLLSYYNCYGFIVVVFFAYIALFLLNRKPGLFKNGLVVATVTIALSAWWFIRNAILYHGDVFALTARKVCAVATGNQAFLETLANTPKVQGLSLFEMVFYTDYYTLVWKSFIAMFGPMRIPTYHYVYMGYKWIIILCLIGLVIPKSVSALKAYTRKNIIVLMVSMIVSIIIPVCLALTYSYSSDFQPQGRYYLPMLLPFAFFMVYGMEKLIELFCSLAGRFITNKKALELTRAFLYHIIYAFITFSLLISVWMMLKYYASTL